MWSPLQQLTMLKCNANGHDYCLQDDILVFKWELYSLFFTWLSFLTPDPYMTFEVKLLITFVATRPLVILSYMIMHVICRKRSILTILKIWHFWPLTPLWGVIWQGHYWLFWSFVYCLQDHIISFEIRAVFIFFTWLTFLTPVTPTWPLRSNCWYFCSH